LSATTPEALGVGLAQPKLAAHLRQRVQITRTAEAKLRASVKLRRPRAEAPASANEVMAKTAKIPTNIFINRLPT
jgi:hypothetical protein